MQMYFKVCGRESFNQMSGKPGWQLGDGVAPRVYCSFKFSDDSTSHDLFQKEVESTHPRLTPTLV